MAVTQLAERLSLARALPWERRSGFPFGNAPAAVEGLEHELPLEPVRSFGLASVDEEKPGAKPRVRRQAATDSLPRDAVGTVVHR